MNRRHALSVSEVWRMYDFQLSTGRGAAHHSRVDRAGTAIALLATQLDCTHTKRWEGNQKPPGSLSSPRRQKQQMKYSITFKGRLGLGGHGGGACVRVCVTEEGNGVE